MSIVAIHSNFLEPKRMQDRRVNMDSPVVPSIRSSFCVLESYCSVNARTNPDQSLYILKI